MEKNWYLHLLFCKAADLGALSLFLSHEAKILLNLHSILARFSQTQAHAWRSWRPEQGPQWRTRLPWAWWLWSCCLVTGSSQENNRLYERLSQNVVSSPGSVQFFVLNIGFIILNQTKNMCFMFKLWDSTKVIRLWNKIILFLKIFDFDGMSCFDKLFK